jgi:hypothetical protein
LDSNGNELSLDEDNEKGVNYNYGKQENDIGGIQRGSNTKVNRIGQRQENGTNWNNKKGGVLSSPSDNTNVSPLSTVKTEQSTRTKPSTNIMPQNENMSTDLAKNRTCDTLLVKPTHSMPSWIPYKEI